MGVILAGWGYDYLHKSVVRGDRNLGGAAALTRYYLEEGTAPADGSARGSMRSATAAARSSANH